MKQLHNLINFDTSKVSRIVKNANTLNIGTEFLYCLYNAKERVIKIGITASATTRMKQYNQDLWQLIDIMEYINCDRNFILGEEKKLKELLKLYKKEGFSREYFHFNKDSESILNKFFDEGDKAEKNVPRFKKYKAVENSVHESSYKNAKKVINALKKFNYIYMTKETQAGKTSDMLATMVLLKEQNPFNRFLVYSALGQNNLLEQTRKRMVKMIYPDGEVKPLAKVEHGKSILGKRDEIFKDMNERGTLYIFVDECHIAMSAKNVFDKFIEDLNNEFKNIKVKYIFISATGFNMEALAKVPSLEFADIKKVEIESPNNYKGIEYFVHNKTLQHIEGKITNGSEVINDSFLGYYNSKLDIGYHIIRCSKKDSDVVSEYFTKWGLPVLKLDQKNPLSLKILKNCPKKPTIILVKQMLKAGDTLEGKENIVSVWDNPESVSNLLQGLLGRLTGIGAAYNKKLRIFTDKNICNDYINIKKGDKSISDYSRNNLGTNVQIVSKYKGLGKVLSKAVTHDKSLLVKNKQEILTVKNMTSKQRDKYFKSKFKLVSGGYKVYSETNTVTNTKRYSDFFEGFGDKFYGFYGNEKSYVAIYDNVKSAKCGIYLVTRRLKTKKELKDVLQFNEKKINKVVVPYISRRNNETATQSNVIK